MGGVFFGGDEKQNPKLDKSNPIPKLLVDKTSRPC